MAHGKPFGSGVHQESSRHAKVFAGDRKPPVQRRCGGAFDLDGKFGGTALEQQQIDSRAVLRPEEMGRAPLPRRGDQVLDDPALETGACYRVPQQLIPALTPEFMAMG